MEPTACAVHAVLSAGVAEGDTVAVVGAGTLGLAVVAALDDIVRPVSGCTVMVGAKHPHQQAASERLGADTVVAPDQLARAVRRRSGSLVLAGRLTNGADVVFDCVGTSESLTHSLAMVRPRGRVVLVGMPGRVSVDLAPLWHRELTVVGAYAYGAEHPRPRRRRPIPTHLRTGHRPGRLGRTRFTGQRRLPARTVRGGHRPCRRRRAPGRGQVVFDLRKPKGPTR